MLSQLLAEAVQLIGVLLILAGAVGYLTLYYRRKFTGDAGGGCGSGCGIPLKRTPSADAENAADAQNSKATAAPPQQFIPAENLADLAARHRQQQVEEKKGSE